MRRNAESPGMRIWRKALEMRMRMKSTTPDEVFRIERDRIDVELEGEEVG